MPRMPKLKKQKSEFRSEEGYELWDLGCEQKKYVSHIADLTSHIVVNTHPETRHPKRCFSRITPPLHFYNGRCPYF